MLSVSYPRIEPSSQDDCRWREALAAAFSILPSDRTIFTVIGAADGVRIPRTFSILPSDRTIFTALAEFMQSRQPATFSILPSDRTIFTMISTSSLCPHIEPFSILPSDRTIFTDFDAHPDWLAGTDFQYPTLGSNHLHVDDHRYEGDLQNAFSILPSDRTIFTSSLAPPPPGWSSTFSILPSDRTIFTGGGGGGGAGQNALSVSYPRIEPSSPLPPQPRRPHHSFQYPTLGSNHLHTTTLDTPRRWAATFSILPSDRTIFTPQAELDRLMSDLRPFSILPSDRTIFTTLCARVGRPGGRFQYPTLGSNHLH